MIEPSVRLTLLISLVDPHAAHKDIKRLNPLHEIVKKLMILSLNKGRPYR